MYHSQRGDNYLYKSKWNHNSRTIKINKKMGIEHEWWDKTKDLSLHQGLNSKKLNEYEKINNSYFKNHHGEIYKYDNPIGNNLDKYNDQNYSATTTGYAKEKNRVITSI